MRTLDRFLADPAATAGEGQKSPKRRLSENVQGEA
jgi:hypothetical protein